MSEVSTGTMPGWCPAFPGASVGKGFCQMAQLQSPKEEQEKHQKTFKNDHETSAHRRRQHLAKYCPVNRMADRSGTRQTLSQLPQRLAANSLGDGLGGN